MKVYFEQNESFRKHGNSIETYQRTFQSTPVDFLSFSSLIDGVSR